MTVYMAHWKSEEGVKYTYTNVLDTEKMTPEGKKFFEDNLEDEGREGKQLDLEDYDKREWFDEQIEDAYVKLPAMVEDSVTIWVF